MSTYSEIESRSLFNLRSFMISWQTVFTQHFEDLLGLYIYVIELIACVSFEKPKDARNEELNGRKKCPIRVAEK